VSTRRNVHALLEAAPHVHRASATSADFCREGVELPALAHLQLNGFLRGPALDVVARRCPNLEVLFADLSDADAPKMTEDLPIRALIDERPRPVPCREQLMDVLAHAPRLEHLSVRTMAHEAPLSFEALPVLPALREIEALPGPVDGPGLRALLERAPSLEQLTITLPASFVSDSLADALEGVRAPARLANVVVHVQRGTAMSARDHQALEALAPKRLVARAA
jgi:hypothetical protein